MSQDRARPKLSEKAFQAQVVALARLLGWTCYHTHDSRRSTAGFPDLVLVRERVVFVELKSESGRPTAEQSRWLDLLRQAGAQAYLWRPADWPEIEEILRRP